MRIEGLNFSQKIKLNLGEIQSILSNAKIISGKKYRFCFFSIGNAFLLLKFLAINCKKHLSNEIQEISLTF